MRRLGLLLLLTALSVHADEVARLHQLAHGTLKRTTIPPPTPDNFNAAAAKTFNITARQWSFSINPSPFAVNEGDSVTLNISVPQNDGSTHGFHLTGYMTDELTIARGQTKSVNFIANQAGNFFFLCTFDCGSGHFGMNGTFIVQAVAQTPPTITSFTPTGGPIAGGTVVAITGANFQTGATVRFGSTLGLGTSVESSTRITTMTPALPKGPVAITVTNPDGASVTSTSMFTFQAPAPAITSFTPDTASTLGGTVVTIRGTNFDSAAVVRFGWTVATTTVVDATTITAMTPVRAAGPVTITVTNPDGQVATSHSMFTFSSPTSQPPRRRSVRR